METRTAGDYTVELNITKKQFDHFKVNFYEGSINADNPKSEGLAFKEYIFNTLPQMITDSHNEHIRLH